MTLAVQAIFVSELVNTIEIPNHNRVYPLSYTATNEYINAILNPITESILEYRKIFADPSTREGWERSASNESGKLMKGLKGGIKGT